MYKILLNITNVFVNFLFLKDSGITLSRNNPVATISKITPEIERNLKTGLLIDVLGNIPVEISNDIKIKNEKILIGLNIKRHQANTTKVDSTKKVKQEELQQDGMQEKKEKEEVLVDNTEDELTTILETSTLEEAIEEEPKKKTKKKK